MSLAGLLEDVATALQPLRDQMAGLVIYPHWSDTPTPPAIDIYPASPFQVGAAFGAGNNQVFITVRARAGMADPAAGQTTLLRLLDPDDSASVEVALGDVATVTDVSGFTQYADDGPTQERLLGCEWRLTTFLD